ncbi:1-deoxy-D-xylulose-5-phosphate synthase [bacterium]|nr:1-deoxy-D-xylulose-5-phosphate synthase [bacterium]
MALSVLERINEPEDLKGLAADELQTLVDEIRSFIIANVSESGGHLAPSLGAIELIVALHRVFDSPRDRLVFDTGHQAYAHKIICGRRDDFNGLRQFGGIGGFIRPCESEHDAFEVGHASTSIAVAMGFARADKLNGDDRYSVAVIGDGAMTGGLALEAMNNSEIGTDKLIVILNDNGMSIAPNIGKISRILTNLRRRTDVKLLNRLVKDVFQKMPVGGKDLGDAWVKLKRSFLYFVSPYTNKAVFESWGMKYFGPYDGHNIHDLIMHLSEIKSFEGPVLVHVITKKGKGYKPAEQHPTEWHGVGSFNKVEGKLSKKSSIKSYTDVFSETLVELAEDDERITAITAAMPQGTGLDKFEKRFPERFFDVGIAEEFAVTFAAGLAKSGIKPVVAVYSTFLQRAFDQLVHDVALQKLPVVFAIDRAGLVGEDGATHHGCFDLSYLNIIPNFTVMAPANENELRHMLYTALRHETGPIAFRYPRGNALGMPLSEQLSEIEIGTWPIVRHGGDCAVLAIGSMVAQAEEAAASLAIQGVSVELINARFLKPLDSSTLARISRHFKAVVTIEENASAGGLGESVLGWFDENADKMPRILRLAIPDRFILHGRKELLLNEIGLDAKGIEFRIVQWLVRTTDSSQDLHQSALRNH